MAEENQTGLMGLLRNFTGAASDKEVEFLKDALPTKGRKPGMESLLGAVGEGMTKESDGIKEVPVFSIKDFMLKQYENKGIQPEIEGSGFQGDERIFVIKTPSGGTMLITQEDYFENFGMQNLTAVIMNRWGEKVYEFNDIYDVWDGYSLSGQEVPDGVYFYILESQGEDGSPYSRKGSVTLIR